MRGYQDESSNETPENSETGSYMEPEMHVTLDNYRNECSVNRHVVFLKTHKTGSETMAGIFRKFAIMNNVSTVISTVNGGHLYQSGPGKYDPLDPSKVKILGYGTPGAHYE